MEKINIYTDGACSGNPGRGGWAYVILTDTLGIKTGSKGFRRTTNNRMEIKAVTEALRDTKTLIEDINRRDTDIKVTVFSDSQLVVNTMTQGWSRKTNADLWKELDEAIDVLGLPVAFQKVKGHDVNPFNNEADRLAVEASGNPTEVDIVYEGIAGQPTQFEGISIPEEPRIGDIVLKGHDTPENRSVEVHLSNGTVVRITGLYGGFEQYNCTRAEAAVTLDIARRLTGWLNGKGL